MKKVAIIGAGPAGLTAAYLLVREGFDVTVFEGNPVQVGGLSRTVEHNGYRIDIGGHRFFSKSEEIENLWSELLPDGFLRRQRSSKILYRGKYFSYPLQAFEAFRSLGAWESTRCLLSYLKAKLFSSISRSVKIASFEDWVSQQFGHRLFSIFFKTYTEKVWGISCQEISADWAAQRIKGLSLWSVISNSVIRGFGRQPRLIKSLVESFRYPRLGPGMLWESAALKIREQGGKILMGQRVSLLERSAQGWKTESTSTTGDIFRDLFDHVISSAPLRDVVRFARPELPSDIREKAEELSYRNFIVVALMLKDHESFPENWLYIHDPRVQVGRIQNFKRWSEEMVPSPKMTCYGMEYFCFATDKIWKASDQELVDLAKRELKELGIAEAEEVFDGFVIRQPSAYPIYDEGYEERVHEIRQEIETRLPNLHLVGRNGMHKYNNQDHSMMTALLTAKNIMASEQLYDTWKVNVDAEYHEEVSEDRERLRAPMASKIRADKALPSAREVMSSSGQ